MAIQRKPKKNTSDINIVEADKFISEAKISTSVKPRKIPVALRFDGDLLAAIDGMASKRGMSRNSIISYWCSRAIEQESNIQ